VRRLAGGIALKPSVGDHVSFAHALAAKTAAEGRTTTLTASKSGSDLRMVMLVAPQSTAPAEIVQCKPTPGGFVLQVKRGDLVDWVAIGPADSPEIKSDGEVACLTMKGAQAVKMMLIKGKRVSAGAASLGLDLPANALADSVTGNLTISAPLGEKAAQANVSTTGGVRVQTANGQPLAGTNAMKVPLPTWKEKQDKMN